ncbi:hypothetical protein WA026_014051 [Henosepilachna vigintioctopunctata]|uniref:Uncharacterized protein n=1 Tax=Henosepilachna vigintioctopunctata TaxID=420089 RepID=A0AAW1U6N4_9CUCU
MDKHPICVICKTSEDKIIIFDEETLQKCREMLTIRKKSGSKYGDVTLPETVNEEDGYHSKCFKKFVRPKEKQHDDNSSQNSRRICNINPRASLYSTSCFISRCK